MGKITKIDYWDKGDRYYVKIDGIDCPNPNDHSKKFSIRARTFPALGLSVGMEITCEELYNLEINAWKMLYNQESWKKEKIRINAVKDFILKANDNVEVNIVGFGADTEEFINEHPSEKGVPDLDVVNKDTAALILKVEVTGTEQMSGSNYWVRPDKLSYAQNHPDENVWIALHYQRPEEKIVFIKPNLQKNYQIHSVIMPHGGTEHFVFFNDNDEEVHSTDGFKTDLDFSYFCTL